MDRPNFLKALPFLYPLEPISWPPPLPVDSFERSNCRRETLLRNFSVSIEPLLYFSDDGERLSEQSNCSISSRGPAFFVRSKEGKPKEQPETHPDNDTFDPAMCSLELSIQSVILNTSTISRVPPSQIASMPNRFASPTAYHKLMRLHQQTGESHSRTKQLREITMMVKIDDLVYQVDLTQIENVQLVENMDDRIPTCLLIQFGSSCIFRIFNMTQPTSDSPSLLGGVQTLLVQLFTAEDQIPSEYPNHYYIHPIGSPTGSSATAFSSSQEPGQRDFTSRPSSIPHHHETPPPTIHQRTDDPTNKSQNNQTSREHEDGAKGQTSNGEGRRATMHRKEQLATTDRHVSSLQGTSETTTCFRKRQAAYMHFQSDLNSLEETLMSPIVRSTRPTDKGSRSSYNDNNNNIKRRKRDLQSHVSKVMSSVPEQLAQSYCSKTQLQEMIHQETERIHSYEVELDTLVQSFWPALARKHASSSTDGTRQSSLDHRPHGHLPQHECIARANALLQKRKEATAEKLALALLPTRGI